MSDESLDEIAKKLRAAIEPVARFTVQPLEESTLEPIEYRPGAVRVMRYRPDTPEGVAEIRILKDGEKIYWFRESPQLKRDITIYPQMLTPEQLERLNKIEQELLEMAYEASEENRTKTKLKG